MIKSPGKPYMNPYAAGVGLGILLFLAFMLTGSGLGASGGINHILVYFQNIFWPEHIDQVPYLLKIAGGATNPLDSWIVFLTIGTVIGGLISGLLGGRVKIETNRGPKTGKKTRWFMAFMGGILMGYGARLARGCTSGQGLTGGAGLSVGSWAFMFAVFAGAYLFAYTFRKFWN